jgi:hypothetical protein
MNPETLRKWLRQAEIDSGERDGVTTTSAREIRELKRKNAELERTICQWPFVSPRWRSWDFPASGHGFSPRAATGIPRERP